MAAAGDGNGGEVGAKGATTLKFGDQGMAVPARMLLSVVDEVRLEIDILAAE